MNLPLNPQITSPIRKIHIHFQGCAGKFWYELGIAQYIQEHIIPYDSPNYDIYYSGESGGALVALFMLLGKVSDFYPKIVEFINIVHAQPNGCLLTLYDIMEKQLLEILSEDAYLIANQKFCLVYYDIMEFDGVVKNNFTSNEDLVKALTSSGYIPLFGKSLFYKYENKYTVDGALARYINGKQYPKFVSENLPIRTVPVIISFSMFRNTPKRWFWLHTNKRSCELIFKAGYFDAKCNHKMLSKLLFSSKFRRKIQKKNLTSMLLQKLKSL